MTVGWFRQNGFRKHCWKLWNNLTPPALKRKRWKDTGDLQEWVYRDDLVRIVVDVPDLVKHRRWMKAFKARWKARLDQLELWLVSYRIEVE